MQVGFHSAAIHRRRRRSMVALYCHLVAAVILFSPARAAEESSTEPSGTEVAARVDGIEILVRDVQREMRAALGPRQLVPDLAARVRAQTLQTLIDRQLVQAYLDDHQQSASAQDVELALTRLADELQGRGRTLDDYCQQTGRTREQLARSIRWTLSWKAFLDRFLTDENREKYFERHKREFDGTELHVAHILWKTDGNSRSADAVLGEAARVRAEIEKGSLSFAEAARRYSQAPTAEQGGDIGWIKRHEPMPEAFSRAAFALAVGEVSRPVVSSVGVHLIRCLDERPGRRTREEVGQELDEAMSRYLFRWAADQQRPKAHIEWTGVIPKEALP